MFTIILVLVISQERVTILIFWFCNFAFIWLDAASTIQFILWHLYMLLAYLGLEQTHFTKWIHALEQEAKMSSLVWICHQLNSSHNQRVVVTLDLEYRHCTKSLPRRLGLHYSWMKWSWGGPHCTCFFLKSHQLAFAPLVNSVWGKYNWQTNASMTLMGASDRCSARALKVSVICHYLGQVLPTL